MKRKYTPNPDKDYTAFEAALEIIPFSNWLDLKNVILVSNSNTEGEVIKRDLFRKLSREAQIIVDLLFDSDDLQFSELGSPETGSITKKSLKRYLRKKIGMSLVSVRKAFKELTVLVGNL